MADAKIKLKKRQHSELPDCKYGASCYRKNPEHLQQYRHPSPEPCHQNSPIKESSPEPTIDSDSSDTFESSPIETSAKRQKTEISTLASNDPDNEIDTSKSEDVLKSSQSPVKIEDNIKEKFLVEMPADFYDFWEFCKIINKKDPAGAFSLKKKDPSDVFSNMGFHLVGPYDVLSKKITNKDIVSDNILCHWRYYYDPPEFLTVLMKDGEDGYHIGYFRDDPQEMPFGLASNTVSDGEKMTLVGDNIFCAMNLELTNFIKSTTQKLVKEKFKKIQNELSTFAKKHNYSLEVQTPKIKERTKKINSKTFHGLGIVVPVINDVGYRPIPQTDAQLKTLLKKICDAEESRRPKVREPFDELMSFLSFATDECDYGMGLEIGIDLFCFGDPYFHKDILHILSVAYDLLNRPEYTRIIKAHLRNRRKGVKLSIKCKD